MHATKRISKQLKIMVASLRMSAFENKFTLFYVCSDVSPKFIDNSSNEVIVSENRRQEASRADNTGNSYCCVCLMVGIFV